MLATSQLKMSGSEGKKRTGTQVTKFLVTPYNISYIKRVTRKFHVVVMQ